MARNFGSLGDLSAVLEELFDLGSDSKASDAKFSVKDKDSSNIIELSAPSDLYEGAVVTAELKDGPAEQIAKLRQQVSDLKRKLAAYEADAKSKRSSVGEKRRRVEADPPPGDGDDDTGGRIVLRLRGLPYSARESEVRDFFRGTKLVSVCLPLDGSGRPSGEGFVEVANPDDESRCMARNRGTMGRRYIEVFRSTERERTSAQNRSRRAPPPSAPPVQNRCVPLYYFNLFSRSRRPHRPVVGVAAPYIGREITAQISRLGARPLKRYHFFSAPRTHPTASHWRIGSTAVSQIKRTFIYLFGIRNARLCPSGPSTCTHALTRAPAPRPSQLVYRRDVLHTDAWTSVRRNRQCHC